MATMSGQNPQPRLQSNGVLPITASQTAGKSSQNKSSGPRLKVVVRRLAPRLTEAEFLTALGDGWRTGQGRVDWFSYVLGKDSKDASKPSRPSRAYLHLTSDVHLTTLSETVRHTNFEDAQNTWNSPALVGPPTIEYAPYGRVPSGRRRVDARQGTIDQDLEFMDFLESLANPVSTKESNVEAGGEILAKGEKVTTTPLVQFLKEKKANKGKEAAAKAAKAVKEAQIVKAGKSTKESIALSASTEDLKKTSKELKKDKVVEKAAREAVKVLTREASSKTPTVTTSDPPKNPRTQPRERGSIAAAARILQRDLGLSPGNAHRKAKADADTASKSTGESSSQSSTLISSKVGQSSGSGKARSRVPTENDKPQSAAKETTSKPTPVILLKKPVEVPPTTPIAAAPSTQPIPTPPTAPASMPKNAPARKPHQPPAPSAGATRAFVKHANPSQGVTEPLLKEAMETFGAVSHVEIDKRKGFAYVDFVEPQGLIKAMAANPTKIAQGTVQVLERKDAKAVVREPLAGPSSRGGFAGRGRGGAAGRRGGRGNSRGGGETAASPSSVPKGPAAEKVPASASGPGGAK